MPTREGGGGAIKPTGQPARSGQRNADWSPYVNQAARVFRRAAGVLHNRTGGIRRAHERL